jgi:hypothetical protein
MKYNRIMTCFGDLITISRMRQAGTQRTYHSFE